MDRDDSSFALKVVPNPAALLAGGRSRRFGRDKARVDIDGTPLILHNLRCMTGHCEPVWVVGPAPNTYADLAIACIPDHDPDGGPMAGIITALRHREATLGPGICSIVACDHLLTTHDQVAFDYFFAFGGSSLLATVPRQAGRWQPVYATYHTRALPELERSFAAGQRSMQRWLNQLVHPITVCAVEDLQPGLPPTFNTEAERVPAIAAMRHREANWFKLLHSGLPPTPDVSEAPREGEP